MVSVEFNVESEGFEEWIFKMHHRFSTMVQTMVDIYSVIQTEMNTRSLIPLDTGRLEESFRYDLVRDDESFIEMDYVFDAIDPKYGYHYALYQHELTLRGRGAYSRYSRAKSGYYNRRLHHRHGVRGTDHYLLKGVQASESMMWTLIEMDYMELFNGGL